MVSAYAPGDGDAGRAPRCRPGGGTGERGGIQTPVSGGFLCGGVCPRVMGPVMDCSSSRRGACLQCAGMIGSESRFGEPAPLIARESILRGEAVRRGSPARSCRADRAAGLCVALPRESHFGRPIAPSSGSANRTMRKGRPRPVTGRSVRDARALFRIDDAAWPSPPGGELADRLDCVQSGFPC